MHARFPKYGLGVLMLVGAATVGCGDSDEPGGLSPTPVVASFITRAMAEPPTVTPELLRQPGCVAGSPFVLRLVLTIDSTQDVIVRALRVTLLDRFGQGAQPIAISTPQASTAATIPGSLAVATSGVLTLPSSSPLAIPAGSSRALPLTLEFGCGAPAEGTLIASIDTSDTKGQARSTDVRVRVGR